MRRLVPRARRATLDFNAALVIVPPEDVWPAIEAVRAKHDPKVFERWPLPHLNIIWPFVPQGEQADAVAAARTAIDAAGVKPFDVSFLRPLHRERAASSLLYLDPTVADGGPVPALDRLGAALQGAFAALQPRPTLHPHLRLGVGTAWEVNRLAEEWSLEPLTFTVADVCLLRAASFSEPFRIVERIPLDGAAVTTQVQADTAVVPRDDSAADHSASVPTPTPCDAEIDLPGSIFGNITREEAALLKDLRDMAARSALRQTEAISPKLVRPLLWRAQEEAHGAAGDAERAVLSRGHAP